MQKIIVAPSLPRLVNPISGLAICLGTVVFSVAKVGINLYFDILSFLFVLGGAIGFLVMRNNPENHIANFGEGLFILVGLEL